MAEKYKLLIADPSEAVREALVQRLADSFTLRLCRDGRTALEMLYQFQPDLMVLDLMLPGMDGLSLLQSAVDAGICPAVLATTRYENDYILDTAYRLGVAYIMSRPSDISAMVERILDISRHKNPSPLPDQLPDLVKSTLIRLGFPTNFRSYRLLRDAILWRRENPTAPITKELYPAIAREHNVSAISVEKDIRSLIHSIWEQRNQQIWQLYFPQNKRPSNDVFISRIAESLPSDLEIAAWKNSMNDPPDTYPKDK